MHQDDAEGATPIEPDDADALIPAGIRTRDDLNAWEQVGIAAARSWALDRRRPLPLPRVLDESFLRELHRRMFGATWRWAGSYRRTNTNIGVPWPTIVTARHEAIADARTWIDEETWSHEEMLARWHHRLVVIHPFPNGNGRWSRLATDLLARARAVPLPTWGASLPAADTRRHYLEALRRADAGEFERLREFLWE